MNFIAIPYITVSCHARSFSERPSKSFKILATCPGSMARARQSKGAFKAIVAMKRITNRITSGGSVVIRHRHRRDEPSIGISGKRPQCLSDLGKGPWLMKCSPFQLCHTPTRNSIPWHSQSMLRHHGKTTPQPLWGKE